MSHPLSSRTAVFAASLTLAAASAAAAAGTFSGPSLTWSVDVTTDGNDINWISPTALPTGATYYQAVYEIVTAEATVIFIGPVTVDLVDFVDPEDLIQFGESEGPAPLDLVNDDYVYPDPPEPAWGSATVHAGIDAGGFGFGDVTNVVFNSVPTPFGTLPIESLHIVANVTVTPIFEPSDVNGDGAVNVLDILDVLAQWGACQTQPCNFDVNRDGTINVLDLLEILAAWS